ncbi:Panacea domain-containing protein [Treponema endosymbiont of Eucomonympha sp.]|uniref:Panacea domain-containing protein n=1 Tax=Treponema endosymbiont of Eucomonympha sp. TaxID=1580831 RepID=UPI0007802AE7|nr:type II toxin-antitoxin system antitoxin SocA domain-containing protein [Treponema endosymbiont of Eucomonympha sp.]
MKAYDMARYICAKKGKMNQLQLQKLIYYIDAWNLAILKSPIIDEDFQAWLHGPVVNELWQKLKSEGVESLYSPIFVGNIKQKKETIKEIKALASKERLQVTDDTLKTYGNETGYYLECLTREEFPWKAAWLGLDESIKFYDALLHWRTEASPGRDGSSTRAISKDLMKTFYEKQLDRI